MIMKKIIILVLAALLLTYTSAGCVIVEDNNEIKPDKYYTSVLYIYVDKQTGVEYLVSIQNNYVTGVCPRYNVDGTLKINEKFKNDY